MNGIERVFLGDWHMTAYACLKALILFIVVAAAFRVTQRRTLAEFTPFDWLTAVAVGSIVGRTAVASDASLVAGIAAVLTLMIAHWALARLRFVPRLRRLVDPPLEVLIRDGEDEQRKQRRFGLTQTDRDAV